MSIISSILEIIWSIIEELWNDLWFIIVPIIALVVLVAVLDRKKYNKCEYCKKNRALIHISTGVEGKEYVRERTGTSDEKIGYIRGKAWEPDIDVYESKPVYGTREFTTYEAVYRCKYCGKIQTRRFKQDKMV